MATTARHLRLLSNAFAVPLNGKLSADKCCVSATSRPSSIVQKNLASTSRSFSSQLLKIQQPICTQKHALKISNRWSPCFLNTQKRFSSTIEGIAVITPGATTTIESTDNTVRKTGFFPKDTHKHVAYWLFGTAGLVFGIVVLGGLTRLTESGLSITEWKPITGVFPPLNNLDWEVEFAKYRDSPEYRILNPNMTLSQYKFIYWMEWSHRIMGRIIGLSFVGGTAYFIARRRVSAKVSLGLLGIATGIGFQGFIGWWMVKSGLQDDLFNRSGAVPRVSQYRLTAHLGTAIAVYVAMIWTGLTILRNKSASLTTELSSANLQQLKRLKIASVALTCLVFFTALSGGLVAGLDAGLIYNEFPYMGNGIVPPTKELFNSFYSHTPTPHSDLYWRNMLENPVTVQFDHRVLATTTFFASVALWAVSRRMKVPKHIGRWANHVIYFVGLQVALGITTLLYLVPTSVAAAHQANSLLVLGSCVVLCSKFGRLSPRTVKVVESVVKRNMGTGAGSGAATAAKMG